MSLATGREGSSHNDRWRAPPPPHTPTPTPCRCCMLAMMHINLHFRNIISSTIIHSNQNSNIPCHEYVLLKMVKLLIKKTLLHLQYKLVSNLYHVYYWQVTSYHKLKGYYLKKSYTTILLFLNFHKV